MVTKHHMSCFVTKKEKEALMQTQVTDVCSKKEKPSLWDFDFKWELDIH